MGSGRLGSDRSGQENVSTSECKAQLARGCHSCVLVIETVFQMAIWATHRLFPFLGLSPPDREFQLLGPFNRGGSGSRSALRATQLSLSLHHASACRFLSEKQSKDVPFHVSFGCGYCTHPACCATAVLGFDAVAEILVLDPKEPITNNISYYCYRSADTPPKARMLQRLREEVAGGSPWAKM